MVWQQYWSADAEQVPAVHLRLQIPGVPDTMPHAGMQLHVVRGGGVAPGDAAARHLTPPVLQDLAAGADLLPDGGAGERLAQVHPSLLQPGHRRHHPCLHRAAGVDGDAHTGDPPCVCLAGPCGGGRGDCQRSRADVQHGRLPCGRHRGVRARAEERAAGADAVGLARAHGLAEPADVHGAGGGGGPHPHHPLLRAGRSSAGHRAGPQRHVLDAAAVQLLPRLLCQPHQLFGDQAHLGADAAGAGQRQGRGGGGAEPAVLPQPHQLLLHLWICGHSLRRGALQPGQEGGQEGAAAAEDGIRGSQRGARSGAAAGDAAGGRQQWQGRAGCSRHRRAASCRGEAGHQRLRQRPLVHPHPRQRLHGSRARQGLDPQHPPHLPRQQQAVQHDPWLLLRLRGLTGTSRHAFSRGACAGVWLAAEARVASWLRPESCLRTPLGLRCARPCARRRACLWQACSACPWCGPFCRPTWSAGSTGNATATAARHRTHSAHGA